MTFPLSRRRQLAVLIALFAAWSIAYADRIVIGTAIIPIAHEFGLSDQAKGLVLGAFYVTYALMQLGGGTLADRYGSRKVLVGCLLLWSIFTALTSTAWSLASLVGFRLLFGVGEGSFAPANARAITESFPASLRGRVQALMCSTVFLGSAVGSAAVGWTIYRYGWRATFPALGALGLLVAAALLVSLAPQTGDATHTLSDAAPRASWRDIVRTPLVWRVAAIWFGSCVLSLGLQAWMPSWLMREHGVDLLHIGLLSAVPFIVSFIGTNVIGHVIDRCDRTRLRHLLAAGALFSAFFLALMIRATSIPMLMLWWTLCMLSFDMVYATVFSIPLKYFPAAISGRTTGLINFSGQLAGAIAPVVMGRLITVSHGSYVGAFVFLIGAGLVAGGVALTTDFGARSIAVRLERS
ncbi:MFS transporter [Pararobbsia silviterrae]|uniref:MFS transporter n=1 Tax=Pararobbsia silviterrae TaxID=1792498 RepID=A0A494XG52_9BURK|nr:MFS transporter [Pararobbsia silviterrae]RKP47054.1 MFS transporter [Pararobbsia silviterrae]